MVRRSWGNDLDAIPVSASQEQQGVLPAEMRAICALLSADWSEGAGRSWEPALFANLDWAKLQDLAFLYKLRPMLAASLREAGWPVPPEVRATVEAAEQQCVRKTMGQLQLLAAIAEAAAASKLRFIVLKGVALSQQLYGTPFIRESFDLDVLVPPAGRARFAEILRAQGCRDYVRQPPLTPRQRAVLQRHHHDVRFRHRSGMVESHHSLAPNPHLIATDFEALWAAHATVRLSGVAVAVLGEADLVHSLIVHGARHLWSRWKWLADLAALARDADAARLLRWRTRAAREGNADIFDSWLLLSTRLTGLPRQVPEPCARNRRAHALAELAFFLSAPTSGAPAFCGLRHTLATLSFQLRLKRSPRYLASELRELFFSEEDWYTLRLPDRFLWLYYVLRPFRVLWRQLCVPLAALLFKRGENARASGTERL
jgi:hypothetical protein